MPFIRLLSNVPVPAIVDVPKTACCGADDPDEADGPDELPEPDPLLLLPPL